MSWFITSNLLHDLPFYWWIWSQLLVVHKFGKCSFIFTGLDPEVTVVFVVSGLKWTVRDTNVLHFTVLVGDLGLVHYGLSLTFVLHGAVCFNAAVTKVFVFFSWLNVAI